MKEQEHKLEIEIAKLLVRFDELRKEGSLTNPSNGLKDTFNNAFRKNTELCDIKLARIKAEIPDRVVTEGRDATIIYVAKELPTSWNNSIKLINKQLGF